MRKNQDDVVILPEDDAAAQLVDVSVWKSRCGVLFLDERIARWEGATHVRCSKCGAVMRKTWMTLCAVCKVASTKERYNKLEKRSWDGSNPVCTFDDDRYFYSPEEVEEYCYDLGIKVEDLMLVHCEPRYAFEVDPMDLYGDELPEDGELPEELQETFDILNKVISKSKVLLSWIGSNTAVLWEFSTETDNGC